MIIVTGLLSWFMCIVCWMGGMVKNRGNGKTAGFAMVPAIRYRSGIERQGSFPTKTTFISELLASLGVW